MRIPIEVHWDIIDGKVMFHGKLRTEILDVTGEHYVRDRRDEIRLSMPTMALLQQRRPDRTSMSTSRSAL